MPKRLFLSTMTRVLTSAALACISVACIYAQTVTVSASHLADASGAPLNGQIFFKPAIPFKVNGLGQVISSQVSAPVTNGAFSLTLADTTATNPLNACYVAWAQDSSGTVVLGTRYSGTAATRQGYGCVQVSTNWCTSGVCNFDNFIPAGSPVAIVQTGQSATVVLGSVADGPPAVTNVGSASNAILNFSLPGSSMSLSDSSSLIRTSVIRDVKTQYGAVGDGRRALGCTWFTINGSTSISCPSEAFTAGKLIVVRLAGAAMPSRYAGVTPYADVPTSIVSVSGGNSPGNTAVLAAPLVQAPNGLQLVTWGSDDQSRLATAFAAGGNIYIPPGLYMHSSYLPVASNTNIVFQGDGSIFQGTNPASESIAFAGVHNSSVSGGGVLLGVLTTRQSSYLSSAFSVIQNGSVYSTDIHIRDVTASRFSGAIGSISWANVGGVGGLNAVSFTNIHGDHTFSNGFYTSQMSTHVHLVNTILAYTGDNCWEFTSVSGDATQVTDNTVEGGSCEWSQAGGGLNDGSDLVQFTGGIRVINPQNFGFAVQSDTYSNGHLPTHTKISGVLVDGADQAGANNTAGILINNATTVDVGDVTIQNGPGVAITSVAGYATSQHINLDVNLHNITEGSGVTINGNANDVTVNVKADNIVAGSCLRVSNVGGPVTNLVMSGKCDTVAIPDSIYGAVDLNAVGGYTGSISTTNVTGGYSNPFRVFASTPLTRNALSSSGTAYSPLFADAYGRPVTSGYFSGNSALGYIYVNAGGQIKLNGGIISDSSGASSLSMNSGTASLAGAYTALKANQAGGVNAGTVQFANFGTLMGSFNPTNAANPYVLNLSFGLQLGTQPGLSCTASLAGQFNYLQGDPATKDVVQVCAHDSTNTYAWRALY